MEASNSPERTNDSRIKLRTVRPLNSCAEGDKNWKIFLMNWTPGQQQIVEPAVLSKTPEVQSAGSLTEALRRDFPNVV
jgi:hypothetical protein